MRKISIVLLVFVLVSCEQTVDPYEKTVAEYLVSHTWIISGQSTTPDDTWVQNPCYFDNTYNFYEDGSAFLNDGTILCFSTPFETGTWSLNESTNELTYFFSGSVTRKIKSIDDSRMVHTWTYTFNGVTYQATRVFSATD